MSGIQGSERDLELRASEGDHRATAPNPGVGSGSDDQEPFLIDSVSQDLETRLEAWKNWYSENCLAVKTYICARTSEKYDQDEVLQHIFPAMAKRLCRPKELRVTHDGLWAYVKVVADHELERIRRLHQKWTEKGVSLDSNKGAIDDQDGDGSDQDRGLDLPSHYGLPDTALQFMLVKKLLDHLSGFDHDCVVAYLWYGFQHDEIAASFGIKHGTARVRYGRAIEKLAAYAANELRLTQDVALGIT